MPAQLKNKVTVITGAASGIGAATARRFAREGARLLLGDLNEAGGEALAVPGDSRRLAEAEALVGIVAERFGRLDILVNNAGIFRLTDVLATTEAEWDDILDTNLKGAFFCSKFAVAEMLKRGKGKIINISSQAGPVGRPCGVGLLRLQGGPGGLDARPGGRPGPPEDQRELHGPANIENESPNPLDSGQGMAYCPRRN